MPGSGQLWVWSPSFGAGGRPGGGGNSPAGSDINNPIIMGHTAGIVLGLLLGIANLFLLYRLAQNAGIDLGCGGGGAKGPGGYYAAANIGGAYESPAL